MKHVKVEKKVPENVVNEEEHILSFLVTEIFGDGETGEGDTGTSAWGFVHLSVDECDLVLIDVVICSWARIIKNKVNLI